MPLGHFSLVDSGPLIEKESYSLKAIFYILTESVGFQMF